MPSALLRACAGRCGRLVECGRCDDCQRVKQQVVDRTRGSARQRGYTDKWDGYSRRRLRKLPFCGQQHDGSISTVHSRCAQRAEADGRLASHMYVDLAEVTDHIVPVSKGGSLWDPKNQQSLCRACNSAKGDR